MDGEIRVTAISVIIIVAGVIIVALVGSYFASMNRDWYRRLNYPSWKPPDWVIPVAWNIIFLLSIASLILIGNTRPHTTLTYAAIWVFIANGVINVLWSVLFFGNRMILPAVIDAAVLCLSVLLLIGLAWPISWVAAILLIPYAGWTAFATALTWVIWRLNT